MTCDAVFCSMASLLVLSWIYFLVCVFRLSTDYTETVRKAQAFDKLMAAYSDKQEGDMPATEELVLPDDWVSLTTDAHDVFITPVDAILVVRPHRSHGVLEEGLCEVIIGDEKYVVLGDVAKISARIAGVYAPSDEEPAAGWSDVFFSAAILAVGGLLLVLLVDLIL